ncbi:tRNA (adenosine(37)-N6)-threonylcarbamoyltransferase complex dimerization subunit type 1 TsaB [Ferruginibacter lapsinanis]|uniref:tRNA (adenosine(37)-N6)-threonylcarbamoyltransferase complex dimerization subunit type 1 TsaB n=1 Tax=Ferruginibacter lapsinanis TaxID=563172 RepID=UPI001E570E5A|nr:tRNA (adenosine(37)-N6)-threonylcarbamoyltransferase complex dimerization subunit type 1 TsaB [Ferruginibacter lapsinanis]UEG50431.1 tRNA (adenosine(37)-N6)-threonylcarbamoyltransferase complex dimerization subunit type 1 TsaB [Ferruginibacter lapsinanis]
MPLILNISTALETACVSIARDGALLQELTNREPKDHSSFLQVAIKQLLSSLQIDIQQIDAVTVIEGPGSYTGLRVGMAAAKGLCYAINKPLITINSLEALTASALNELQTDIPELLLCPMIDARRMEVYTAIYGSNLQIILNPSALILNPLSFEDFFNRHPILFFGSGAEKWGRLCANPKAVGFHKIEIQSKILSNLSFKKYLAKEFADIAYSEPLYIKEFFSPNA